MAGRRGAASCSSWAGPARPATPASKRCPRASSSAPAWRRLWSGRRPPPSPTSPPARAGPAARGPAADRPTSALDPVGRRTVRELLEELRRRGTSVLLNSHLLSEIELVCDRVAIMLRGGLVAEGSPADLARARGVEVETDEGTRLFDSSTREDAPRLVAELVAAGRKVYGVRVLTSTLEETYLEAVGQEAS